VLLTGPLAYLPAAALAAVVFPDRRELVGRRRAAAHPGHPAARVRGGPAHRGAVVGLGVEQGIVLAIVASVVDHLRHSYSPLNSIMVKSPEGHWRATPVTAGARTEPGLAVYRFGTSLYYANAARLAADITAVAGHGPAAGEGPLRWLVIDWTAIGDVDYTAAGALTKMIERLHERARAAGVQLRSSARCGTSSAVRHQPGRLVRHPRRSPRGLQRPQ